MNLITEDSQQHNAQHTAHNTTHNKQNTQHTTQHNIIYWTTAVYAVRRWPKRRYAAHDCTQPTAQCHITKDPEPSAVSPWYPPVSHRVVLRPAGIITFPVFLMLAVRLRQPLQLYLH